MPERTEILDLMSELKLFGMKAAFDLTKSWPTASSVATSHSAIMGDLLKAEIAEKAAGSIKYQLSPIFPSLNPALCQLLFHLISRLS